VASAPTSEIGQVSPNSGFFGGAGSLGAQGGFIWETELNTDLRFPMSVRTFDRMRHDPQVAGLLVSALMPIRRYRWYVDPRDARPEVAAQLAQDLGLPLLGADRADRLRTRDRFSWDDHLRHALLALAYGFYFFEQVGRIEDGLWRLRKLAPRTPQTVNQVWVAPDGGLVGIKQNVGQVTELIPVDRLVAYCWDREGGNWYGRSALRPLYGSWRAKRELVGIDVTKHRRNGMGVPVARALEKDVTDAQLKAGQAIASAWRVGETSGAALPYGMDVEIKGIGRTGGGQLPDTIASIQYHDQQMARAFAQMFAELGQTPNGSRALGAELGDHFELTQDTIGGWILSTVNAHVVEDWVDWNYGESEPAPAVAYDRDEGGELAIADLVSMVGKGLVVVDGELQEYLRERYSLPAVSDQPGLVTVPSLPLGAVPPVAAAKHADRNVFAAARAALDTPTTFRRDLLPHEAASGADFAGIDAAYRTQLEQLLATWEDVSQAEIDDLVGQVKAAGSLEQLAGVQASAAGGEILAGAMRTVAATGAAQAAAEARSQGVDLPDPDLTSVNTVMGARAAATDVLLARSISEAGGREALRQAGGSLSNDEVAAGVRTHLEGLSSSYLADRLGGAVQTAQNYGRAQAMAAAEAAASGGATYYASELLDAATCDPCAEIDGQQFESWDDMNANYGTSGFVLCEGGDRCRGTAVALYGDEQ